MIVLVVWAHPLVSWLFAPLVMALAGPAAMHYPEYFGHLPALAAQGDWLIGLGPGSLVTGLATRLFAWRWRGQPFAFADAWREVLPRWPALVLVQLPPALLLAGLAFAADHVLAARLSSVFRASLPLVLGLVGWLLRAAWAYAPALVVLERRSAAEAWLELPHTWVHGALPATLVLALGSLVEWPASWLLARAGLVAERGLPELVVVMVLIRVAFALLAAFVVTGGLTLVWTSAVSEQRGRD